MPESGLAKNRLKQYLETAQSSNSNGANETGEELPEKGTAKSLLDKWKTIENVKYTKEPSPPASGKMRALSKERQVTPPKPHVNAGHGDDETDYMPQTGTAKNLLNKWQNIDKEKDLNGERKQRSITPPAEDVTVQIEKGYARNALAK